MTTREYLKARVIRLYSRSSPLVLVLLGVAIWGRRSTLLSGLVLTAIAAYMVAYIVFMRRTPCLRCSSPLQNAALNWGSKRQPAARCPRCGLSIDEEVGDPRPIQEKP
jgi:DNA-directed RNA polymerase subunit RPC12/RpoP